MQPNPIKLNILIFIYGGLYDEHDQSQGTPIGQKTILDDPICVQYELYMWTLMFLLNAFILPCLPYWIHLHMININSGGHNNSIQMIVSHIIVCAKWGLKANQLEPTYNNIKSCLVIQTGTTIQKYIFIGWVHVT